MLLPEVSGRIDEWSRLHLERNNVVANILICDGPDYQDSRRDPPTPFARPPDPLCKVSIHRIASVSLTFPKYI